MRGTENRTKPSRTEVTRRKPNPIATGRLTSLRLFSTLPQNHSVMSAIAISHQLCMLGQSLPVEQRRLASGERLHVTPNAGVVKRQ
jgi:hypothetical protein